MTINQALNLNSSRANMTELRQAVTMLKSSFNRSAKAIHKIGYETELMKTVKARVETEEIFSEKIGKLSRSELQEVFDTYRAAKGHKIYDDGKVIGWEENITSTKKGFIDYQKRVAKEVLALPDYTKMTQDEQRALWDRIDDIRNAREGYFLPGSTVYGSDVNIKRVTAWIQQGKSNSQIIKLLKKATTADKASEANTDIPISPMELLPDRKDF